VINSQRIGVVLPAYNAEATLSRTVAELDWGVVDEVVLVDDASSDQTVTIARELGLEPIVHDLNKGYGGNQKTCYRRALELGLDVVIMVHPDYQYSPLLVPAMASLIAYGEYDLVLGSRILAQNSVSRGMPRYKYVANRFLTFVENIALGQKLSEYHTGLRAFSGKLLGSLPVERNSDDFVFDNQIIAQAVFTGARIGEVSCPTRYATDSSSINLKRSVKYGFGVLRTCVDYRLNRHGIRRCDYLDFEPERTPFQLPVVLPAQTHQPEITEQSRLPGRQGHQLRGEVANAAAARPGRPGHSGTETSLVHGELGARAARRHYSVRRPVDA
jgi:glycosyltransferase involved in cell wall biosynthesis